MSDVWCIFPQVPGQLSHGGHLGRQPRGPESLSDETPAPGPRMDEVEGNTDTKRWHSR